MILKRLKEELFFLKRLLEEGYGRYLFSYFKNRFGGLFLIKNLTPLRCSKTDDFELHILCQKKDLWMMVWAIRSFLHFSRLCPRIIVHDDGTLGVKSIKVLESKFQNLKVIPKFEADKLVEKKIPSASRANHYRLRGHPLILKLIDIFLLSTVSKVMVLDSDILFCNYPKEIVDFLKGQPKIDALVSGIYTTPFDLAVSPDYLSRYDLLGKRADFINSGLMLFKKDKLSPEKLWEYFEHCLRPFGGYLVEMAGWACLLAQTNFQFLPAEKYKIKGKIDENTIIKHFTNPRRYELYAYGIDMVRKSIKENLPRPGK